jgi:hypothetical protein
MNSGEQTWRNGQAKRRGGLEIDGKRQQGGLRDG